MSNVTIENVTDVVIASLGQHGPITDRQREIMTALLRHLHGAMNRVADLSRLAA